ncbi:glycerophosphodiester phosphodiesterase [Paenibacillus sp. GCM10012306]|uniref:glycerophosphodiester phosphodiesterase n=1 Tax=Paenibacillus sp. GCM10012306 TaxID=3317342 RepID=UPI00361871D5
MSNPLIIAHTGCEGTPYNTLESSLAGRAAGAEVLEVDVRATKDGVCVLFHDDHTAFSELTFVEIIAQNPLQLSEGSKLEQLETVLLEFKGQPVSFNLDIKNDEAVAPTLALLEKLEMWEQIYFTGATNTITNSSYRARVMWNTPETLRAMNDSEYDATAQEMCSMAKQAGYSGVNVDYPSCRPVLVQYAHEQGLRVWIYTLQDQSLFAAYEDMKVDAISTIDVSAVVSARARRHSTAPSQI